MIKNNRVFTTASASWIFDEKCREKTVCVWQQSKPAALFTNTFLYHYHCKTGRTMRWYRSYAGNSAGLQCNTMPLYNQITLDIIHLVLGNFFPELENSYNCLLEQQITHSEWYFFSTRGSLVLCVCFLMRWQCAEPPKKIWKNHWRAKASQRPPFWLTAMHFSLIFILCVLNRDTGQLQKKPCSFKSFCSHLFSHPIMAKVHR